MSNATPNTQIRPKLRSRKGTNPARAVTAEVPPTDEALIEETRQRMEHWMGLASSNGLSVQSQKQSEVQDNPDDSVSSQIDNTPNQESSNKGARPVTSILKTPKYSQKPVAGIQSTASLLTEPRTSLSLHKDDESSANSEQVEVAPINSPSVVCKDLVVERDPTKPSLQRKLNAHARKSKSHSAVEGYVPSLAPSIPSNIVKDTVISDRTGSTDSAQISPSGESGDGAASNEEDTEPLVLNSLEELFEVAGMNLPQHHPHKITADAKLVEADIAFSVMSHDEYNGKLAELKEQHDEERKAQLRIFSGTDDIFEHDDSSTERESSDDEDDDLLDMLMGADTNEDDYFDDVDQDEMDRLPRPFRLLWETFSEWITPEAVAYLTFLEVSAADDSLDRTWTQPVIERSDIEASRCAGLMAMVKLYLPKCLEELGYPQEHRRTADTRLGELLRMFNYVQEAPKFPVKLWKAMTCILLEIVLVEHQQGQHEATTLPLSIKGIDMTLDEYRYLSRSAVKAFGVP